LLFLALLLGALLPVVIPLTKEKAKLKNLYITAGFFNAAEAV
jgi:hypothetical protein